MFLTITMALLIVLLSAIIINSFFYSLVNNDISILIKNFNFFTFFFKKELKIILEDSLYELSDSISPFYQKEVREHQSMFEKVVTFMFASGILVFFIDRFIYFAIGKNKEVRLRLSYGVDLSEYKKIVFQNKIMNIKRSMDNRFFEVSNEIKNFDFNKLEIIGERKYNELLESQRKEVIKSLKKIYFDKEKQVEIDFNSKFYPKLELSEEFHYHRAEHLIDNKMKSEAINNLEEVLLTYPTHLDSYKLLVKLYHNDENSDLDQEIELLVDSIVDSSEDKKIIKEHITLFKEEMEKAGA